MENIKPSQLHRTIFLVLALCFITQVSLVSAFEFDNVKNYNPITREVKITNAFGLGSDIGTARLNTPLNVKVALGYQKVAEFDIFPNKDYNNALKQFTFKDMKSKKNINRNYDLKYKSYKNVLIKDYKTKCLKVFNLKNNSYSNKCNQIVVGSHYEKKEVWNKIISNLNLKKNKKLTIGVFTDVKEGDYIDWVPTIYGVEVPEWATWTESLNVDIIVYYDYQNSSMIDKTGNGYDGSVNGGASFSSDGIIGKSVNCDGGDDWIGINTGGGWTTSGNTWSISIWLNGNNTGDSQYIADFGGGTDRNILRTNGGNVGFNYNDNTATVLFGSSVSIFNGAWHHLVFTQSGTASKTYVDGVSITNLTTSLAQLGTTPNGAVLCAIRVSGGGAQYNGQEDEFSVWDRTLSVAEVIQLNNGGSGITYTDVFNQNPNITLNSPSSTNYTTPQSLNINFTASDDINLTSVKLYVNGILNQTNASGINNSNYIFPLNLGDGDYTIYGKATDNESKETNSTSIRIVIDTLFPKINVTSPSGIYDYKLLGENETLNVTFTDTNLDTCWYNYNETNITIDGCLTGVKNSTDFILKLGDINMTIYANDTSGNLNSTFISWTYKVLEINQTYNNATTEGSLETFLARIRLGSGYSIVDAVLINYNGSTSTGQSFASGDNTVLRKANFLIPNVDADTNITFYWNITLSDSTVLNLTLKNQTIYNLGLDNCSSFTTELYNFTVVDEKEQTILPNATIEIAVNIYDETRTVLVLNHSAIYEKINPLRICLNKNLSNSTIYSVDVVIRYEDTGFANEYYNIVNSTLTVNSSSQIITLYDLNSTDSTDFQLSFIGSNFLPVENALVYIDRQYISENTFKTVELPKTDYNGQAVLHLVRNDVIYNIRIIKDKVILGNFENLVAFCDDFTIGDCNIELNAFDSVEGVFNYDSSLGIIFTNPTYNATMNKVSFNFVTSDGSSKTVLLEVTRNDIFGNNSICNASLISSGGTLTCNIDPNIDESTLNVNVYVDGILEVKSNVQLDSTNFGVGGYLIMFVMALSFIFMFSGSKTGVLVSIGLTLASSIGMGLISGTLIGIGASGIWLLVILFIGIYKLNSERQE